VDLEWAVDDAVSLKRREDNVGNPQKDQKSRGDVFQS